MYRRYVMYTCVHDIYIHTFIHSCVYTYMFQLRNLYHTNAFQFQYLKLYFKHFKEPHFSDQTEYIAADT